MCKTCGQGRARLGSHAGAPRPTTIARPPAIAGPDGVLKLVGGLIFAVD